MGTTYCLFKRDKKERFELDKGYWYKVFDFTRNKSFKIREIYPSPDLLNKSLKENLTFQFSDDYDFTEIAKDIFNWCGNDLIEFWMEGDAGFEAEFWEDWMRSAADTEIKYPYTGSRFKK